MDGQVEPSNSAYVHCALPVPGTEDETSEAEMSWEEGAGSGGKRVIQLHPHLDSGNEGASTRMSAQEAPTETSA